MTAGPGSGGPGTATCEQTFTLPVAGCDQPVLGYRTEGDPPDVMFIHGFRSNCEGEKARALTRHAAARGHAAVRFDLRGRAGCGADFRYFTLSGALADCIAVLDSLTAPVVVIGSSLGALLALCLAQRRSTRVAGLLLLAPAVRFVDHFIAGLAGAELERWRTEGTFRFPDAYEGGEYTLEYGFCVDAAHYREVPTGPLHCPVAIIQGAQDEVVPAADAHWLAARVEAPSCSLDIVAGGDHRLGTAIPLMCSRLDMLLAHHRNL